MQKNTPRGAQGYWLHIAAMFGLAFVSRALVTPADPYWIYEALGGAFALSFLPGFALVLLSGKVIDTDRLYRHCWIAFAILLLLSIYGGLDSPRP